VAGRHGLRYRMAVLCAAAVMVPGSLASCSFVRPAADDCMGGDRIEAPAGPISSGSTAPGQPSRGRDALWVPDRSGALRAVDGPTDQVLANVDTGSSAAPVGVVPGGGLVWVWQTDGSIAVVDPAQARVAERATVPIPPIKPLADNVWYYAHGALWIAQPGRLWRVGRSGEVSSMELPPDFRPTARSATDRWLWLAGGRRLARVDPAARTVFVTGDLPVAAGIGDLLGTPSGLFAVGWNQSQIWVLDADSGILESSIQIPDGELVGSLFDTGTALWATGNCGHVMRVTGLDRPEIYKVKISSVSQEFSARVALGSLWVADEDRSELVRIDLQTAKVLARIPVEAADPDDPAFTVFAGQHSVWLMDAKGYMHVDPATNRALRLASPSAASTSTPASGVVAAPPR
jgi:hypothetical protein